MRPTLDLATVARVSRALCRLDRAFHRGERHSLRAGDLVLAAEETLRGRFETSPTLVLVDEVSDILSDGESLVRVAAHLVRAAADAGYVWLPDDDVSDWLAESWSDALDAATRRVVDLLGPHASAPPDVAAVRAMIEAAHEADDPDWRFDSDRLIGRLLEAHVGSLADDVYERLVVQLDDVFPVEP